MKLITKQEMSNYESYLYKRGRDIEIAKYNYFFLEGERIDVAFALTIYQNRDGGFGHGLEPDSLNPYSSPLQTSEALKILKAVGYNDSNLDEVSENLVKRALHYIYYYCLKDGKINPNVPSNNDFPHASWWEYDENFFDTWRYNPTAYIVALTLHFTKENDKYYKKAYPLVPVIIESFNSDSKELVDKHYVNNMMELYDVLTTKNIYPELHKVLKDGINKRIEDLMDKDEEKWKDYSNTPLELLQLREFVDTDERKELVEKNLDFVMDSRNSNGLFDVNWSWNNDYEEIELQRVKWVGLLLVNNLITFKKFDRIEK